MTALLLLALVVSSLFVLPALGSSQRNEPASYNTEKFKFLYFASQAGKSHFGAIIKSGRKLVQQGHRVVSLLSSSNGDSLRIKDDTGMLSTVVFNSSYTQQERITMIDNFSKVAVKGSLNFFLGPVLAGKELTSGRLGYFNVILQECDDLLADSVTMEQLRKEKFDMIVTDDYSPCGPLLAQTLDTPFIFVAVFFVIPKKHAVWTGLEVDPSYIPERNLGLPDRMTFFQRVQNVLAHYFYAYIDSLCITYFEDYDRLKVKYNIKPEISTLEAHKRASLYLFMGSFGLEFPRSLQPNTVLVLHGPVSNPNQTMADDVAEFLDTATAGVVLFSLGTFATAMERPQVQLFADGFAMLPHRVLWQSTVDFTGVQLGANTITAKWLPMTLVMEHPNVRIYVNHGGTMSLYEALWVGLPVVGLPLGHDQRDNMVHVESRGAGLTLDIGSVTPGLLSRTIRRVINEPRFHDNARRISQILRDLQTTSSPVDTVAHWILHVTRFGGEHLRPAVQDLNALQRSLLDVYLFFAAVLALVIWASVSLSCFCCKFVSHKCKDRVRHLKKA